MIGSLALASELSSGTAPVQFESLADSLARLPEVIRSIPDIIRNPSQNPMQAAILLGIAVTIVLIVVVSILIAVNRPSPEEEQLLAEDQARAGTAEVTTPPISWLTVAGISILLVAALWVVVGVTTSNGAVCSSCHSNSSHAQAGMGDPHRDVACVACHESGGSVARVTVNVLTRVQHVAAARIHPAGEAGFGQPSASDACARCHDEEITGTFYDRQRGVRISHKEPIAAGAQCIDCHALNAGVVDSTTVGMSPCLRCHNGEVAKAECSVCHVGDPSGAIRSAATTQTMASELVPNPQCNGCHYDMTTCNACHGIAMPHSPAFLQYGHARVAAIDIWNHGRVTVCVKCHYPGHNSCQRYGCHMAQFPSHPSPDWRTVHQQSSWSESSVRCACHDWNQWDHDGMNFCQICHPVKPSTARP